MRQEDPSEPVASADTDAQEVRAWYAQIATISNSVMLVTMLALGAVVAYVISDMRSDLQLVSAKIKAEAPAIREKEILIKELRDENDRLKVRLEQMQREVARATSGNPALPPTLAPDVRREKLSEVGRGLADCINAALNGKGSVDEKCDRRGDGDVVVKHHG